MRPQAIIPCGVAVALTVAAGFSLAEEHAWAPAATLQRPMAGPTGDSHAQATSRHGVGSRALTGGKAEETAADQGETATGVDRQGPPLQPSLR